MITDKCLYGGMVYLRQIEMDDCTDEYVNWLNDFEVNQYLETKWIHQNMDSIKAFVNGQRESEDSELFAICMREDAKHVGNIKIGPVNMHYKYADISYFVGNKEMWGRGIARDAISLVCRFGFEELGLHKIEAGTYDCAIGSQKALMANGFRCEGSLRQHVLFEGNYIDCYRWGILKEEYRLIQQKSEAAYHLEKIL